MHIAVLGSPESWYLKDLVRAAAGDHQVSPLAFRGLSSTLDKNSTGVRLGECNLLAVDAVLVRTMPPGSL